jgi:hypothetical protein
MSGGKYKNENKFQNLLKFGFQIYNLNRKIFNFKNKLFLKQIKCDLILVSQWFGERKRRCANSPDAASSGECRATVADQAAAPRAERGGKRRPDHNS